MKSRTRKALVDYIRANAKPVDKFSHQPRVYQMTKRLAGARPYDDDVVFAAVYLHDLGVFIGHRPEDPAALAKWDHVAYTCERAPALLRKIGFPAEKIPAVLDTIRAHLPSANPTFLEGTLIRDADILDQLGAATILRTIAKVGRDTRFICLSDALAALRRQAEQLPSQLRLPAARRLAQSRVRILKAFLAAAQAEANGVEW